ncbi:UNVERIFIED_CONTAM: Gamma-cadinene synthase, partial [Sesamum indicum]
VKQLGRAYNKELKWFMGRQMPTFEDYFANTVYTSCIYVMFTALIPGMQSASEEIIDWLMSEPEILIATAKMGRYVEDLGTHEVKQLGRAYNKELKWFMGRQMPTFEDYFANTVYTSCIYVMFTALIPGMQSASEETIDWLMSEPEILIATAKMGRYVEDLGTHERENKDGQMLTAVDCYMKQYGISKEETLNKFMELAEDGWKDLNTEWVTKTSTVPKDTVEQLLNYARVAEVTYKNCQDGYTNPEKFLAPQIIVVRVDPIAI